MQIDKIFHIADLHIRNYQRHTEYNNVFKRLFSYIKQNKTSGSIIYLAGDIVHQKTEMSPELISMVTKFLRQCTSLCPTILICGNHDTNLKNSNRLDALSPIVESIKNRKLYYWKDTGVYKINPDDNVSFAVFSVFDSIDKWPKATELPKADIKIALHHGSVMGATTDMDYIINNTSVTVKNFKGYDYGLLGDIHKQQYLNEKRNIAYSSSLIQQNYGESIQNHGIIVWDLKNKTNEFANIENDIAYATLEFNDNQLVTDEDYLNTLPKYLRLRVKHENTDLNVIYDLIDRLKHKHTFKEYILRKKNSTKNSRMSDLTLGDVRDIEFQNKLITEFINLNNPDVSEDTIDGIRYLNRMLNSELNHLDKHAKNTTWNLIGMEFSNMFSFGEGNRINFKDLEGIQGIFAPNASGKSSILEILTFCLFDKCSKTFKAEDVMNNNRDDFKVSVTFEINEELYTITREAIANENRKVRVNVDFYNTVESLKGKDRDETNKIIRSFIGTYDDFMLTALSTQTDNRNFIFKTQRERKELLYSFLDLKIFTDLHYIAKNALKEKKAVITNLTEKMSLVEESEILNTINDNDKKVNKLQELIANFTETLNEHDSELKESLLSIVPIPNLRYKHLIQGDLDFAKDELNKLVNVIIPDLKDQMQKIRQFINLVGDIKVDKVRETSLKNQLNAVTANYNKIQSELNSNRKLLNTMNRQSELLLTYEYDPDCKYCVNNELVKNAIESKNQIEPTKQKINKLELSSHAISEEISELTHILNEITEQIDKSNKLHIAKTKFETLEQKIETLKLTYKNLTVNIQAYETELYNFKVNEEQIIKNNILQDKIKFLENEISIIKGKISRHENTINNLRVDSARKSELIKIDNSNKEELEKLNAEYDKYIIYANATSPHGVPYVLLAKVLPVIENEINQLLHGLTDFTVELINDERSILCYLRYPNGKGWPIELASGMERFFVSVVSRVALIEVTSLARPNFLAIDEGFGVLDSNNLVNVSMLFDKIRDKFDFIMLITHLDSLKDIADKTIDITKEEDYSYINV